MITFLKNDKDDFFKSINKSFFIYKYTLIIFLITSSILLIIGKFNSYIGIVSFIVSILVLIAILFDLFFIVRFFWGKLYAKIIYTIIGYFAYIKATVIAKNIVYINTGLNPDAFQSAVDYLAGWFLIPAWLTYISIFLFYIGIILIILQYILIISQDLELNFFKRIFSKFNLSFKLDLKKFFFHMLFFSLGIGTFQYYSDKIIIDIYTNSSINIIKEKIKNNSYYLNNKFICNNKKIKNDDYIKVIGDNIISIVRVDSENQITFYKEICND